MNSVDSMFGLHVPALALQNKRGVVLANNLANVDTPGYRAQDMDVPALLRQEITVTPLHIKKSHSGHMTPIPTGIDFSLQLRSALQGSLDKNTVDPQQEKVEFTQNAMRTKATINFISGISRAYMTAVRGE